MRLYGCSFWCYQETHSPANSLIFWLLTAFVTLFCSVPQDLGRKKLVYYQKNKRKFKNKAISELLYNPEMLLWVYIQRKCKWCFQRASAHTDSTQHWSQQLKHGIIKHPSLINGKRHIEKTYIRILLSHTKQGKPVIVTTCLELDITKLSKIVQEQKNK